MHACMHVCTHWTLLYSTLLYSTLLYSTLLYSTRPDSTRLDSTRFDRCSCIHPGITLHAPCPMPHAPCPMPHVHAPNSALYTLLEYVYMYIQVRVEYEYSATVAGWLAGSRSEAGILYKYSTYMEHFYILYNMHILYSTLEVYVEYRSIYKPVSPSIRQFASPPVRQSASPPVSLSVHAPRYYCSVEEV